MASDDQNLGLNDRLGEPRSTGRVMMFIGILLILFAFGWVAWSAGLWAPADPRGGLTPMLTVSEDLPPQGRYAADPYIGSKACQECHPGEYAYFSNSGHSRTFRAAVDRSLTDRLHGRTAVDPEKPDVRWKYTKTDGQFLIDREESGKIERFVADYAFGSGHHATTFVTVLDLAEPKVLEHRLTYYSREGSLLITPGQSEGEDTPITTPHGRELAARETRKCFRCHSTQLSARLDSVLDPTTMIPNVSCERCHGPARAHVKAAMSGANASELTLPFGADSWTAETQLRLCGDCHRHPSRVPPDRLRADDPELARFQPIGVSQSRCYTQSAGAMSCVTCHNPHARASSDRDGYNVHCLKCHYFTPAAPAESLAATGKQGIGRVTRNCPVSPEKGCVDCHMPKVDSGQHVLFTDHWIRIRDAKSLLGPAHKFKHSDVLDP
jgi:hypothetical protein